MGCVTPKSKQPNLITANQTSTKYEVKVHQQPKQPKSNQQPNQNFQDHGYHKQLLAQPNKTSEIKEQLELNKSGNPKWTSPDVLQIPSDPQRKQIVNSTVNIIMSSDSKEATYQLNPENPPKDEQHRQENRRDNNTIIEQPEVDSTKIVSKPKELEQRQVDGSKQKLHEINAELQKNSHFLESEIMKVDVNKIEISSPTKVQHVIKREEWGEMGKERVVQRLQFKLQKNEIIPKIKINA